MNDMTATAKWFGRLLILLGLAGYVYGTYNGNASWTALIPAIFGLVLMVLGYAAAAAEGMRKHLMHGRPPDITTQRIYGLGRLAIADRNGGDLSGVRYPRRKVVYCRTDELNREIRERNERKRLVLFWWWFSLKSRLTANSAFHSLRSLRGKNLSKHSTRRTERVSQRSERRSQFQTEPFLIFSPFWRV